jgi:hypothetical protein
MDNSHRYPTRLLGLGLVFVGVAALAALTYSWLVIGRMPALAGGVPAGAPVSAPVIVPVRPPESAPSRPEALRPSDAFSLFLPEVHHTLAFQQPIFGVQMGAIGDSFGLTRVVAAKSSWVRSAGIGWAEVESTPGVYDWSVLGANEAQWINASAAGLRPIVVVGGTPGWAQAHPGKSCGSILPDKLSAFGNFLNAVVKRYSVPPYNLKYWEIWNEPDVDPSLVPGGSAFGCWGDQNDAYYGGGYYGQMLQTVYPRIKAADPAAQVFVGGLLLDCDPNNPPAGKDCKPARFLEGILRQSGGAYFDGIGVHAYDVYGGGPGVYSSPNWHTASNSAGNTLAMEAKVDYVRGLLSAYGVTGKLITNNESGVGLFDTNTNDTYEATKAYYMAEVYATAASEHLLANLWFALDDDWHHQALLNPDYSPRPAYFAYKFASEQLVYGRYLHPVNNFPNVKGFVFNVLGHDLWVLWSKDTAVHPLTLPGTPVSIRDVDGTPLAINGNQLSLGPEPLYVEWAP